MISLKLKKIFDFSEQTIDKASLVVASGFLNIPDPVTFCRLINAIYYFMEYLFMEYLEKCDMLEGIDPEAVRGFSTTLHGVLFDRLAGHSSDTFCFELFPFWRAE